MKYMKKTLGKQLRSFYENQIIVVIDMFNPILIFAEIIFNRSKLRKYKIKIL